MSLNVQNPLQCIKCDSRKISVKETDTHKLMARCDECGKEFKLSIRQAESYREYLLKLGVVV